MANPRQSIKMEDESPSSLSTMPLKESTAPQVQNTSFLGSSSSNSPASSLSSFESSKFYLCSLFYTALTGELELNGEYFQV